jgi:hypothetical protein
MPPKGQRSCSGQVMLLVFGATLASNAYAYIDPVTGSFLVQGLVAGVMALMAGVRSIRRRVLGLFRRNHDDSQA